MSLIGINNEKMQLFNEHVSLVEWRRERTAEQEGAGSNHDGGREREEVLRREEFEGRRAEILIEIYIGHPYFITALFEIRPVAYFGPKQDTFDQQTLSFLLQWCNFLVRTLGYQENPIFYIKMQ